MHKALKQQRDKPDKNLIVHLGLEVLCLRIPVIGKLRHFTHRIQCLSQLLLNLYIPSKYSDTVSATKIV